MLRDPALADGPLLPKRIGLTLLGILFTEAGILSPIWGYVEFFC